MACIITGLKPSELPDPVVPIDNNSWFVIETPDGRVCKVHPEDIEFVLSPDWEYTTNSNFTGTTFTIPLAMNGGKLPDDTESIIVNVNGLSSALTDHWTPTRNGVGVSDAVEFVSAKAGDRVSIRFPKQRNS